MKQYADCFVYYRHLNFEGHALRQYADCSVCYRHLTLEGHALRKYAECFVCARRIAGRSGPEILEQVCVRVAGPWSNTSPRTGF